MRLWRFAQGDAQLAQDLLSAITSPVRESIGSNCVGLLWVISRHNDPFASGLL